MRVPHGFSHGGRESERRASPTSEEAGHPSLDHIATGAENPDHDGALGKRGEARWQLRLNGRHHEQTDEALAGLEDYSGDRGLRALIPRPVLAGNIY